MLTIVVVLMLILLVGGAVLAYVAYPHRGEDLPIAPQAGHAVRRGVSALPFLTEERHGADAQDEGVTAWLAGRR